MVLFLVLLLGSVGLSCASSHECGNRTLISMPPKTPPIEIQSPSSRGNVTQSFPKGEHWKLMKQNSLDFEKERQANKQKKDQKPKIVFVQASRVALNNVESIVNESEMVNSKQKLNDEKYKSDDDIFEMEL